MSGSRTIILLRVRHIVHLSPSNPRRAFLLRQWAVPRYTVSVPVEPTISTPQNPIEPRKTAQHCYRSGPPNLSPNIQISVRSRFQPAIHLQHADIVQQILHRNLQSSFCPGRLQIFESKSTPCNDLFPKMYPAKTTPAFAVVKNPSFQRTPHC